MEDIANQNDQKAEQRTSLFGFVKSSYTLKPTLGSLPPNAIFFTEKGSRSQPFYHHSLINLDKLDYETLSELLFKAGYNLPQRALLPFYGEAPFVLPSSGSIHLNNLHETILPNEAETLMRWLLKAYPELPKEYIYQYTDGGRISINLRKNGINNFCSEHNGICEYIATYFPNILLPLPEALKNLLGNHILHSDKLLERLIFEALNQKGCLLELTLLILAHGNDALKQKLLSRVQSIDMTATIVMTSLNYNLLKLCFSIGNPELRKETLGTLAYIIHDGKDIQLSKIQNRGSDSLTFEHPQKGNLTFSVNQLLGGDANGINQFLTNVLEHWVELGLGTQQQIALSLGINEHRKPKEVWQQMLNHLRNGEIENGEQLAFIWAFGQRKELEKLGLKVNTLAGWLPLKNSLYLQRIDFIQNDRLLNGEYRDLLSILKLNNELIDGVDWTVQTVPFIKGNDWVMPGIEQIDEQKRPAFWKYLYDNWELANSPEKILLSTKDEVVRRLLGLLPSSYILVDNYSLSEEKVPIQLLVSYGLVEDNIDKFMAALGAQHESAAVVRTRKFFNKDGGNIDTSISPSQIVGTLKWLSTNQISVQHEDIAPFYRNLVGKCDDLNFFPAYSPGSDGLKIISLSERVYHINKEELLVAKTYELKASDIAEVVKAPIINLGILQDWAKYLTNKTIPLNIKWKEIDWELAQEEAKEWAFPFYIEWKSRYHHFQILHLASAEIPRKVLVNGNAIKLYRGGKAAPHHNTNVVFVGGADTEHLLNEIDNIEAFSISARIFLRQCYQAQAEQFENFIELAKNDSGFAQLLKERAETIKLHDERIARAEVVKNTNSKYTLDWFLSLLELVRVQEKSVQVPELSFSKCERLPAAEKTYELSESIGRIPSNIETFDEIPAAITYLDSHNEPAIANTKLIASEKHQKLWVMFPETAIQPILGDLKKILNIRLEFTRSVDLIEELKNGFRRLNLHGTTNLKLTLSKNIDFIFGPPGTGKTTELARRLLNINLEEAEGPIVVLTPTNKAADVLTKKIIELNNKVVPSWLVRAGTCTDPFLLREKVAKYGDELLIEAKSNTVLITTIHRFPYFMVPSDRHTTEKSRLCDCPWAQVIFDEASMIPIAYITHAIQVCQKAKANTRFLVAGDPLQIPPVFDLLTEELEDFAETLQEENIYSMIGLNSFNTTIQKSLSVYGNRIENLMIQHRSIPAIGELFSKFQYGGKIQHSRGTPSNPKPGISRPLPQRLADMGFKPITIIRYPVKSGDSIFKPQKLDGSPMHIYSSLLVSEIIKTFRSEVKARNEKPWTIGVLAPYRSQADVLLKMIEAHPDRASDIIVTTDTVHGFQGDENNIVFAVFNPSGTGGNISCSRFLKKEFIINVAISRAEDYLIMLIPDDESKGISGLPLIRKLIELANETTLDFLSIIHSTELEERLTGEKKFFELKSFSTAHQKVNIYGKPDLPYIIRFSEKSLDVHWQI